MRGEEGQYILTGPATPVLNEQISHTGTGRISRIRMRTMSLFEANESMGAISLKKLFDRNHNVESISNLEIEGMAKSIVRGGWPVSITSKPEVASKRAQNYVYSIVQFDVSRVEGIEKNPNTMFALLRSLSRNISTEANYSVLIKDMEGGENESISRPTVQSYLNVLQRLFVIEDLEAWNPSIRSATPLRVSPKRQFVDPSIATAALGLTYERLLLDFNMIGICSNLYV